MAMIAPAHANSDLMSTNHPESGKENANPITSSRNANWWYLAFRCVTIMLGTGVLGLPYAMSRLGWVPGIISMILSWIIALYNLWQMVQMHEMVPGKRFGSYHELVKHAFGERLGLYIVVPLQLIIEISDYINKMVIGGKFLKYFQEKVCTDCKNIELTYFIMIFACIHLILSQLPNFISISDISLTATVMSLSYSTIAWGALVYKGKQEGVEYGYRDFTTAERVLGFFNAMGGVAFAYAGHNEVLEIQATIPSTPENPSKKPMWRGVVIANIIFVLCNFPVALVGYWVFGNAVDDNVLISLEEPRWLINMACVMVVVHVIVSYQTSAMPYFNKLETLLMNKMNFPPGFALRLLARSTFDALIMFLGMTFPFYGGLLGFFERIAIASITCILPCVMWLSISKPRKFSLSWITTWISIIYGLLLMILPLIEGLRQIIIDAKIY